MNCIDCQYWNRSKKIGYGNYFAMGLGVCEAIPEFWDSTEWDKEGKRRFTDKAKDRLAFTQDGSDYMSILYTMPDFGCVQFKALNMDKNK